MEDEDGRAARKRKTIIDSATTAFLRNGYAGTSMDEIAALAAASKQTVYKHFIDKEQLFAEVIRNIADQVDARFRQTTIGIPDTDNLIDELRRLAHEFATSIMQPQVMELRRLVVGTAARFPEVGVTYWERGFQRVLITLAERLNRFAERGMLHVDDPFLAANHFAGLILWIPVNKVMFQGRTDVITPDELEYFVKAGAQAFLAAYEVKSRSI